MTEDPELARKAVDLVPNEMLDLRVDVLLERAEASRRGGDQQHANEAVEEATELYERKGNVAALALISE